MYKIRLESLKYGVNDINDLIFIKMIKLSRPKSNQRIEWVTGVMGLYSKESKFMTEEQKEVLSEATEYLERVKVATKGDENKLAKYLDEMEKKMKRG